MPERGIILLHPSANQTHRSTSELLSHRHFREKVFDTSKTYRRLMERGLFTGDQAEALVDTMLQLHEAMEGDTPLDTAKVHGRLREGGFPDEQATSIAEVMRWV